MARIVLSSCVFRYPMGGMMSWLLQYLVGFQRLGHDVTYVEKAARRSDCFDPTRDAMGDDCGYGIRTVADLWARFGVGGRWHFVDIEGQRYGLAQEQVEAAVDSADLFIEAEHLPCGEGLFAVRTVEEAASALEEVERDYARHSRRARELAHEFFDAGKVFRRFMDELGLS